MKLFDRWARLLEEQPLERVHAPFVRELQQSGFLKVSAGAWVRVGPRTSAHVACRRCDRWALFAPPNQPLPPVPTR